MRRLSLLGVLSLLMMLALAPTAQAQNNQFCSDGGFPAAPQDAQQTGEGDLLCFPTQEQADAYFETGELQGDGPIYNPTTGEVIRPAAAPEAPQVEQPPAAGGMSGGGMNVACAELGDTGEQAQQQAQAMLNQDPSDPNGLDADGDGLPCEFTESSGQITYEDDSTIFITTTPQQPQQTQQPQNLPDTGGLPLGGIAAGLGGMLVAGGLLVRRRLS